MESHIASAALLGTARTKSAREAEKTRKKAEHGSVIADTALQGALDVAGRRAALPCASSGPQNVATESSLLGGIGDAVLEVGDAALTATKEVFGYLLDGQ
ncbi:MAG: hypothetical protein LBO00_01515 [Zoogloeaceae bacterium]|nr:hypothetical protein [Zoogloeaceae bacterium]